MAPLYVFWQHEKAVAPAAEYVTSELLDRARLVPQKWRSSTSVSSMGISSTSCRNERVREREAGPMPSDTMKIRLRFPSGRGEWDVWLLCWSTTARTMTAAVAASAQTNKSISRRRAAHGEPAGRLPPSVAWSASSSSSASWSDRSESAERREEASRGVRADACNYSGQSSC